MINIIQKSFTQKKRWVFLTILVLTTLLLAGLIGLVVGLYYQQNRLEVVLNNSDVILMAQTESSVEYYDSELVVFIFMIIFSSLIFLTLVFIIVSLLVLKFKNRNKIKISLPSYEFNNYEDLANDISEVEND